MKCFFINKSILTKKANEVSIELLSVKLCKGFEGNLPSLLRIKFSHDNFDLIF